MLDLNELKASAWILWNAIDMHVDSVWADKSSVDYADWESFDAKSKFGGGFWGIAVADHDAKEIALTKKYYAYGQFSRYIRPGYTIIGSDNEDMLVAYDPKGKKVVIVAVNTAAEDRSSQFDLSAFAGMGDEITAIRTSGSMENGENWADVSALAGIDAKVGEKNFVATVKGNSITTFIVEGVDLDTK
jgi:O-glycosyl hydrolase